MRILIITHPRSGGMSLMTWIAHELKYNVIHEPFTGNDNEDKRVYNENNIIVKIFPNNVDLNELILKFDKVICHKRENKNDVAISMLWGSQNHKDEENKWHKTYVTNNKWIKDNEEELIKKIHEVNSITEKLEGIDNCLNTTYDGVFNNKTDITKLLKYLEITKPFYLDILDNRHKLQNGDIGMEDIKKTIYLI
jgi:hypothetical protein